MKAIRANDGKDWKYTCACVECEWVLEIEASDLRYVYDQRDGAAVVFQCSVCRRENWRNASIVPKAVQGHVQGWG